MDKNFYNKTLIVLCILTALDLVLWVFKTQTAIFLTVFVLFPLWALWIWFNPDLDNKKENKL